MIHPVNQENALMNIPFNDEIEICLRSRFSVMWVHSHEECRIVQNMTDLCERTNRTLITWDMSSGFRTIAGNSRLAIHDTKESKMALTTIENLVCDHDSIFILKDFHNCLRYKDDVVRQLRNLAQSLKSTRKSILITSPQREVPDDLKDDVFVLDFPRPSLFEMGQILQKFTKNPKVKTNLTPAGISQITRAAMGLTSNQAQRVFAKSIVEEVKTPDGKLVKPLGTLDDHCINMITEEKKSIVKESIALDFYSTNETIENVGGLEILKNWLKLREKAFSEKARDYGLPLPKGIALLGIPGTGKSLTAKTVASLWRMPLIRLDVGALFGKYVGQSEENTRRALSLIESVTPCVVWIDEMEKAFSISGGTSMRVMADFLSWLQEKKQLAFVIGTINDVSTLPPEFLRRGRFDEVFFLDLPSSSEREEIFRIHLRKRHRNPDSFDTALLSKNSEGYVGSEIEQSVIDGMYLAFSDPEMPERELRTDDILHALKNIIPLSRSQKENIEHLRHWLRDGRAKCASLNEISKGDSAVANIDLT